MSDVDHVLRVFTDERGHHGNALGVLWDTARWSDERCQERAALLGYSETIFVDDPGAGRIRIFTPTVKFPFAGHPTVGAAWLLHHEGHTVANLVVDAGVVPVSVDAGAHEDAGVASVRALPQWCPPFRLVEVESVAALEAAVPGVDVHDYLWTWLDEGAGSVRARAFVGAAGVREDEATGAAAIRLAASLGRPLTIRQGAGSVLRVAPSEGGLVTLSGRVVLAE